MLASTGAGLKEAEAESGAAGSVYINAQNITRPFVVSEKNSTWGTAEEVPGIAALSTDGFGELSSVSCASAGNCSAGGYYSASSGYQAFVVNEVSGTWGTAEEVPGTAALNTDGDAGISALSCSPVVGSCGAGGSYENSSGQQVFVVNETP